MNPLISYAYSTSDNAARFGCFETGCYYLAFEDSPIAGGFATWDLAANCRDSVAGLPVPKQLQMIRQHFAENLRGINP